MQASKPIFDDLNAWKTLSSAPEPFNSGYHSEEHNYPTTVYFAYLTLGLYVWRALIRSAAISLPPPYVVESDEMPMPSLITEVDNVLLENFSVDLDAFPSINPEDIEWPSDDNDTNSNLLAKELYRAAQAWAMNLIDFVWHMALHKVDEFWHRCKSSLNHTSKHSILMIV